VIRRSSRLRLRHPGGRGEGWHQAGASALEIPIPIRATFPAAAPYTAPVLSRRLGEKRESQGEGRRGVRFACDKALRYVVDQVAFLSLLSSGWARAYYDQRARGHSHRQALRALGAKWLKIIFVMWQRHAPSGAARRPAAVTMKVRRFIIQSPDPPATGAPAGSSGREPSQPCG
jgi:hypothetical protein